MAGLRRIYSLNPMKPRIHLLTRADDAGSCRSANEAILECVEAGVVKNVSFLAVGPEIEHAVELLGGRDDIAYGLHVCLNSEWRTVKWGPLTNRPVLVDENGHFWPLSQDTKAAIEREIKAARTPGGRYYPEPADVEMEASYESQAQLKKLLELGLNISYADEHMGVSWISKAIRSSIAGLSVFDVHPIPSLPVDPEESDEDDNFQVIETRLKRATGDKYVWVTHPGKIAPDMNAFHLYGQQPGVVARERDKERQLLLDPRLPELFRAWKVKPTRYDELKL